MYLYSVALLAGASYVTTQQGSSAAGMLQKETPDGITSYKGFGIESLSVGRGSGTSDTAIETW